ncbi:MAG: hypothetical protein FJ135_15545, partial [Deltaproteobacteria bacterium]|nr:hypothetical protein [Deltaproteobacteria bacterium]
MPVTDRKPEEITTYTPQTQEQKKQPEDKTEKLTPKFGPPDLAALWNELGCRPQVQKLTDDRRKKAGSRLRPRG